MKYTCTWLIIISVAMLFYGCVSAKPSVISIKGQNDSGGVGVCQRVPGKPIVYSMKGVGIDLPIDDFHALREAGISVISTEWGMEEGIGRAKVFLDKAQSAELKVVMDGGFSYTAWGFTDDDWDKLPEGKKPVWQKQKVQGWVRALKDHPAICAWDICNEFGENLPSGATEGNSGWPDTMITTNQIKQAKADVLEADATRPIHIRMYDWDRPDMPVHITEVLQNKIADIISLNLYSNYMEDGQVLWRDVIGDAGSYYVDSIKDNAPGTIVWVSIAAFEYQDSFKRPSPDDIKRDFRSAQPIKKLDGISFFCWGPVEQWDPTCKWYLPITGPDLWETIKQVIRENG